MGEPFGRSQDAFVDVSWPSPPFNRAFGATGLPASPGSALRRAILSTLIYADIFEYPLTRSEIQRYLVGHATSVAQVAVTLDTDGALRRHIGQTGEWFHLDGRRQLVDVRRERVAVSACLWPVARHYAARIARLPFVRLVGVTGGLAMDNAGSDDDIDLFILVQPGRLWLCRLLVLTVVKLAARRGYGICPNFLLSTDHLRLSQRNLFTAHEIVQMVPLDPGAWYRLFLDANGWVKEFLPNALAPSSPAGQRNPRRPLPARVAAGLLSTRLFDPVERWEMMRKVRRLSARLEREGGSVAFSAHECRGHFAAHDAQVLAAYRVRLAQYGEILG